MRNVPFIEFVDGGFNLCDGRDRSRALTFDSIQKIIAYKKDLVTTDKIVFEIHVKAASGEEIYEVDEEMEGFDKLDSLLKNHLLNFDADWWAKVAKPAFRENKITIYPMS